MRQESNAFAKYVHKYQQTCEKHSSPFAVATERSATKFVRMKRLIVGYCVLASVGCAGLRTSADSVTVNGPSQSSFRTPTWSASAVVPSFTLPSYSRLTDVSYTLYGGASVSQNFSTTGFHNINGNGTITLYQNGVAVPGASLFLFPFGSGVGRGTVAGFDSTSATGHLPLSTDPGTLTVQGNAGSGPSFKSLGSVQVTYNYTPIGLTQSDPILPVSSSHGVFNFSSVPSARWFDPPSANAFKYNITTPGDAFTGIGAFPTGFQGSFHVTVKGVDFGRFTAGQSLAFPTGTTSFEVSDISPSFSEDNTTAFPIELTFSRSAGVGFTATAVPEVPMFWIAALPGVLWAIRRSSKSYGRSKESPASSL